MPELLEKAFAELAKLPEAEQEALAAWLLEELASERRWLELFAASEDTLTRLADEALSEHDPHRTEPLDTVAEPPAPWTRTARPPTQV